MPPFDQTPDKPESFGYKTLWFAIKASDPTSVLNALEFGGATPANWVSGLAAAYPNGVSQTPDPWVFVSPPVDGWVLAVCAWFPYAVATEAEHDIGGKFDVLFSRLTKQFDDVQFFGSDRRVGFVTWARARRGEPTRIFSFADGEVLANVGEQTSEEAQLGFANFSGLSPLDACDKIFEIAEEQDAEERRLIASGISLREAQAKVQENSRDAIPDETDVVDLAALWSLDPTRLSERDHPSGLGLAAPLPSNLMQ